MLPKHSSGCMSPSCLVRGVHCVSSLSPSCLICWVRGVSSAESTESHLHAAFLHTVPLTLSLLCSSFLVCKMKAFFLRAILSIESNHVCIGVSIVPHLWLIPIHDCVIMMYSLYPYYCWPYYFNCDSLSPEFSLDFLHFTSFKVQLRCHLLENPTSFPPLYCRLPHHNIHQRLHFHLST